ncbi:MAG: V-type ATP synthase subunit I [Chlamydiota bacterium]
MTIIRVKKYLFIGVREDIDTFFKRAQEKGFIEFIASKGDRASDYPENVDRMIKALKILRKQPAIKKAELTKDLDAEKLSSAVVENAILLDGLQERQRLLEAEIVRIEPLGDFDLKEIRRIERETARRIQFFCVRKGKLKTIELDEALIPVASDYDIDYFMTISHQVESFAGMVEMDFEKSLEELRKELVGVRETILKCQSELKENAAYIDFLKEHLVRALNRCHLARTSGEISRHMDGALFAVEGWIPENRLYGLFPLLEGLGIHAEEIATEEGKRVPTYMENKSFAKVGEDLVHIYDTPATTDKDPSGWVFWAFAIFFAMIISDAGYGLIFLALALFVRKKFKDVQASGKRFLRLFTVISSFCIGWGVLSGAYFGLEISPESPINKVNIIHILAVKKADYHLKGKDETYRQIVKDFPQVSNVKTGAELLFKAKVEKNGLTKYKVSDDFRDSIFMEIALIVGVIHIGLALLRKLPVHFAGIGWVFAMIGSYLFFPKVLNATSVVHFVFSIPKPESYIVGQQLFWGGIGLALAVALIQHKWGGFIELTKVIELFADVLSYLRLYALGLAAMILAETFNEMGMKLGFAAGFFVILIGHAINIIVGIMGGTIHGLRLNFIEWYHHSFEGGGKLFKPLKLMKSKGE